jgi:hypothetical protein
MMSVVAWVAQAAPIEDWTRGNWFDALFQPHVNLLGEFFLGVVFGGTIVLSMYIAGRGDLAPPTTVAMLMTPIAMPFLPGWATGIIWGLVFLGLTSALMAVARRYVLEP